MLLSLWVLGIIITKTLAGKHNEGKVNQWWKGGVTQDLVLFLNFLSYLPLYILGQYDIKLNQKVMVMVKESLEKHHMVFEHNHGESM